MTIWFLTNQSRLLLERKEIERLQSSVTWLIGVNWNFEENGLLSVYADIQSHQHLYKVKLIYPSLYPATPPIVKPVEEGSRLSTHQYSDGTLCLEWRPDNWQPEVTGAEVLKSAYRLIHTENPLGNPEERDIVSSSHFLTQGQSLRNRVFRLYVTRELLEILLSTQQGEKGNIKVAYSFGNTTLLFHVTHLKTSSAVWNNIHIPTKLRTIDLFNIGNGIVYRTRVAVEQIRMVTTLEELESLILHTDKVTVTLSSLENLNTHESLKVDIVLLLTEQDELQVFWVSNEPKLYEVSVIHDKDEGERRPISLRKINEKTVGIVGLGSLGSKVAVFLARMGVKQFYLIDDDIFLPVNIQRHVLDWRNVGEHKVDALEKLLSYISPSINIEVSKLMLKGQESTAALNTVLSKLGQYDLIIDATANPVVFNILASISKTYGKPMVWGEVFAGGIGGLIARSRPGKDPMPQTMRDALNRFTEELPNFEYRATVDYSAEDENGEIITASDADVSVIASHLTRLAADTVLNSEPSRFPCSMYLIGMERGWCFEQPFYTIPVETDHLLKTKSSTPECRPEELESNYHFLKSLIEKLNDTDSTT
jgi:molybdopterin/thiamine biosynthesis adenylyltransferase/ubiquitin-protein ligase